VHGRGYVPKTLPCAPMLAEEASDRRRCKPVAVEACSYSE